MSSLGSLLDELAAMRLPASTWAEVEDRLRAVDAADPDPAAVGQIVFEARVERRFRGGRSASTLPPTKQTSALPWVGLVCGALVLAVGGLLGGGAVLVGVALLGAGVFAVAMAGSRVAHRSDGGSSAPVETPVALPPDVAELIDELRH